MQKVQIWVYLINEKNEREKEQMKKRERHRKIGSEREGKKERETDK